MTRDSEGRPRLRGAAIIEALLTASRQAYAPRITEGKPNIPLLGAMAQAGAAMSGFGGRYHRKPKKYLLNPQGWASQAKVVADRQQRGGNYNVLRDGKLTHIVMRRRDGKWYVRAMQSAGVSNGYDSPEKAVAKFRLVVHTWKH